MWCGELACFHPGTIVCLADLKNEVYRDEAAELQRYEKAKNKWRCVVTLPGDGKKTRWFGPARSNIREAVSYMLIKYEGRISPEERGKIHEKARALQLRRCGVDDVNDYDGERC